MKSKWFRRMLAGALSAAMCCGMMAGCGSKAKTADDLLFGKPVASAFEKFGVKEADVVEVKNQPEDTDAVGLHQRMYFFEGESLYDVKDAVLQITEMYQVAEDGSHIDVGVTNIGYHFPADAYADKETFIAAMNDMLRDTEGFHNEYGKTWFYDQNLLTEEQWQWIKENTNEGRSDQLVNVSFVFFDSSTYADISFNATQVLLMGNNHELKSVFVPNEKE